MFELEFKNGTLPENVLNMISAVEEETADMIAKRDEMRSALLKSMEENGVKKLDTPSVVISYIAPSDRETFDKKALKSDMPDIYEAYADFKPVKSSIRVKLK